MQYTPDVWICLKVTVSKTKEVVYRLLAGWSGSYLYGSSWRLNSGITKVIEDGDNYIIYGHTSSTYVCHKNMEQTNSITADVLHTFINSSKGVTIEQVPLQLLLDQQSRVLKHF